MKFLRIWAVVMAMIVALGLVDHFPLDSLHIGPRSNGH
jgi:hypothetical protein